MDKIRIGKDITVNGAFTIGGVPLTLDGLTLEAVAVLKSSPEKEYPLELSVSGNTFSVTFRGKDHEETGKYIITIWQNRGDIGETAWDVQAFKLVDYTFKENDDDDGLDVVRLDLGAVEITNKVIEDTIAAGEDARAAAGEARSAAAYATERGDYAGLKASEAFDASVQAREAKERADNAAENAEIQAGNAKIMAEQAQRVISSTQDAAQYAFDSGEAAKAKADEAAANADQAVQQAMIAAGVAEGAAVEAKAAKIAADEATAAANAAEERREQTFATIRSEIDQAIYNFNNEINEAIEEAKEKTDAAIEKVGEAVEKSEEAVQTAQDAIASVGAFVKVDTSKKGQMFESSHITGIDIKRGEKFYVKVECDAKNHQFTLNKKTNGSTSVSTNTLYSNSGFVAVTADKNINELYLTVGSLSATNETVRFTLFIGYAKDVQELLATVNEATTNANNAATAANTAATKATTATNNATNAATNATTQANYAKAQGDAAKVEAAKAANTVNAIEALKEQTQAEIDAAVARCEERVNNYLKMKVNVDGDKLIFTGNSVNVEGQKLTLNFG